MVSDSVSIDQPRPQTVQRRMPRCSIPLSPWRSRVARTERSEPQLGQKGLGLKLSAIGYGPNTTESVLGMAATPEIPRDLGPPEPRSHKASAIVTTPMSVCIPSPTPAVRRAFGPVASRSGVSRVHRLVAESGQP